LIICNNCGVDVEDSMRFCNECGAEIPVHADGGSAISRSVESRQAEPTATTGPVDAHFRAVRMAGLDSSVDDARVRNARRVRVAFLALGAASLLVFAGGAGTWLILRSKVESIAGGGPNASNSNRGAFEAPSGAAVPVAPSTLSSSSSGAYTPKAGSVERKMIMDALRGPVQDKLTRQVIFKVDHLKIKDGWAFMRGVPKKPDGSSMNYKGTAYQSAVEEGAFDDWICALLQQRGDEWRVVVFAIGATDVAYEGWDQKYKAPSEIFR
jgi:hypothetical protein